MKLKKTVKSLIENSLGITIMRGRPVWNTKADPAICALRRWSPRDVVFDVGANDGRTVLRLNEALMRPQFYSFEPCSQTYKTLVEQTAHLKNVRCFQMALGAAPGRQKIYLNDSSAMNSFYPTWAISSGTERSETVEVRTVDEVMAEQKVEFIHLLKIDTEGYDMEVLRGAQRALSESRVALVQVEAGVGQSEKEYVSLEQMRCHLAPLGYLLYGIYTQARVGAQCPRDWPAEEAERYEPAVLVYCDALFLRADLNAGTKE